MSCPRVLEDYDFLAITLSEATGNTEFTLSKIIAKATGYSVILLFWLWGFLNHYYLATRCPVLRIMLTYCFNLVPGHSQAILLSTVGFISSCVQEEVVCHRSVLIMVSLPLLLL